MPAAAFPENEQQRLEALNELGILYTPLEDRFDRITRTLTRLFDVPIAYLSLIDDDTQWLKSVQGLDITDSPRSSSLCAHTLLEDEYLVCPDLSKDPRFNDNPFVKDGLELRFYAGFTLKSRGHNIGTLCMVDTKPREFTEADINTFRDIATWAQTELHLTQLSEVQVQLITELDEAQRQAKRDSLTGFWNHGTIEDIARRAFHRSLLNEQPLSIMMVDIDEFKLINDQHGHPFGDQVLREIASEITGSFRPGDALGRYGGDEFMVILENCPLSRAMDLTERLLNKIRQLKFIDQDAVRCSISIGVASTENMKVSSETELIKIADDALYQAKEHGRNRAFCARQLQ